MKVLRDIRSKIINDLEKEFKFSKSVIYSDTYKRNIEVYTKETSNFVLCINFTNLNSYINLNREIHSFFSLKGIKYNLVNIFFVPTIKDIENTYFQTEFYEEAIFIEESTGNIKSFNIHNVGFLNVIKNVVEGTSNKRRSKVKNNHLTIFLVSLSIIIYFILGIITLFFTGSIVEKNIGKMNYIILIILGIFFGNFASYLVNFSNVFGVGLYVINYAIIGALFILAFKHRDKVNRLLFIFIFSFIGINLLNSMFSTNIDNFGSLASFISGIIFMKTLDLFKK